MKDDKKKLDLVVALGGGKDVPEAKGSGEVEEEPSSEKNEALVAAVKAFREALESKDDEAAAAALETAVASC
jgi:hypothetical protein